ncbi:MAG: molybdopterin-dependent oxidoreductase, partial [Elusimicrobiota bacterium]|nr:molybdopterin-dependent oxidoreductase [Elusimicrobiota bacterium]
MDQFDKKEVSRREFVKYSGAGALMLLAAEPLFALLKPTETSGNPLDRYPDRGWEKLYRDLVATDGEFCFLCAPNDTHNCLLKAHTKNGVAMYFGPSYGYGKAKDLDGNQASHRWDPRLCQKGLALIRKVYGPRRLKYPMVRKGWKEWADLGFPRDGDGRMPEKYRNRGKEPFVKVSWDEAFKYSATAMDQTARFYDGDEGKARLTKQGYDKDMIEATKGAGVQVLKFRGGMPLLGATRIFG